MPSDAEMNLDAVAHATTGDWILSRIVWLADLDIKLCVSLIVDGGMIQGDVVKAETVTEPIDAAIRDMLDRIETSQPPNDPSELANFDGMTTGDLALVKANMEQGAMFTPLVTERRERDAEMAAKVKEHERIGTSAEDLPEEVMAWIQERFRPKPVITLQRVVWFPAGGGKVELPAPVRVLASNVSAWWLGRGAAPEPTTT